MEHVFTVQPGPDAEGPQEQSQGDTQEQSQGSNVTIVIPLWLQSLIRHHASYCAPEECCGLLFGPKKFVADDLATACNTANDKTKGYVMCPEQTRELEEMIERRGKMVVAIYHSHPSGDPEPSGADTMFNLNPELVQVICASNKLKAWIPDGEGVRNVAIVER